MPTKSKLYVLQAPNKDYLVLREGAQDQLLGTFRNRADAYAFLRLKQDEEDNTREA